MELEHDKNICYKKGKKTLQKLGEGVIVGGRR